MPGPLKYPRRRARAGPARLAVLLWWLAALAGASAPLDFHDYYAGALEAARQRHLADTNDTAAAWQLGRACFDLGEFAPNATERAVLATQGIAVCRDLVARQPDCAPAHYYLALNLGQLARTRSLSALKLVKEMEHHFHLARKLDEQFSHAGPDRSLGLLYRDAPGWPASIGSKAKARQHLLRALQLSGAYPENQLNWTETLLEWGDAKAAQARLKELQTVLATNRVALTGDFWAASWTDWDKRWLSLTNRLGP